MTNLLFRINHTSIDDSYANSPSNFVTLGAGDSLIFSAGSAIVADGQPIPSQSDLNRAGTLLDPLVATIVAHYFLADSSENELVEIHLAGNQNKRYVFACSFDGPTASEPQLEAWDDSNLNSYLLGCLGNGTPANSWYKAKCTTSALPGAAWTGTPLAGSGASNIILLNNGNGALGDLGSGESTQELYFNFHVKIPAAYTTPGQYLPILLITYTTV